MGEEEPRDNCRIGAAGVSFVIWKDQITDWFVKQPVASTEDLANKTTKPDEMKTTDPVLLKSITPTTGEV